MSIFKRGSVWWLRFTAPDGREIRKSAQTTDRRQAQELHDRRKADAWRQAKLGEQPRHTWQEAVVRWIEEHPDRKSLRNVTNALRQADPVLGHRTLDAITRDDLALIIRQRRAAGVKNSTINTQMASILAVLHAAQHWGWVSVVPSMRRLAHTERRVRWLTREEADRLLQELPPRLAAMARFSLATGLREQNVCRLEWSQVDVDRRQGWFYGDQMKAGRALAIPLNVEAVCVLREQHGRHPRWVFPTIHSQPPRNANTVTWRKALARAGIEHFRWHDLRHTWASWHVQAGTPLPVLKELGGWASLEMVLRYAHLGAEHLAKHAERISRPHVVRTKSGTVPEKSAASG
jgi:integrase